MPGRATTSVTSTSTVSAWRKDQDKAYTLYRLAADAGHSRAMSLVGRCFEEGWGVAADPVAARAWYRRSAEGGYFRGQYNLATLLLADGEAVEAATWFERALAAAPPAARIAMQDRLALQILTDRPDCRTRTCNFTAL